jgi:8-oxo-dGTP pyrophosphatase MutT (NUDIX family)
MTMRSTFDSVQQAAAVPIQGNRICLVTSRRGKHWVVPKGCVEPGKTCAEIALQETWEEAGLVGILERAPVGTYVYEKWAKIHHVTVFLLRVTEMTENWPEAEQRQRCWLRASQVLTRIEEPGLRQVLRVVLASDAFRVQTPAGNRSAELRRRNQGAAQDLACSALAAF